MAVTKIEFVDPETRPDMVHVVRCRVWKIPVGFEVRLVSETGRLLQTARTWTWAGAQRERDQFVKIVDSFNA